MIQQNQPEAPRPLTNSERVRSLMSQVPVPEIPVLLPAHEPNDSSRTAIRFDGVTGDGWVRLGLDVADRLLASLGLPTGQPVSARHFELHPDDVERWTNDPHRAGEGFEYATPRTAGGKYAQPLRIREVNVPVGGIDPTSLAILSAVKAVALTLEGISAQLDQVQKTAEWIQQDRKHELWSKIAGADTELDAEWSRFQRTGTVGPDSWQLCLQHAAELTSMHDRAILHLDELAQQATQPDANSILSIKRDELHHHVVAERTALRALTHFKWLGVVHADQSGDDPAGRAEEALQLLEHHNAAASRVYTRFGEAEELQLPQRAGGLHRLLPLAGLAAKSKSWPSMLTALGVSLSAQVADELAREKKADELREATAHRREMLRILPTFPPSTPPKTGPRPPLSQKP